MAARRRAPRSRPAADRPGPGPIVVLSRNPRLYSTRRLGEAASKAGLPLSVVDTLACGIVVEKGHPALLHSTVDLSAASVVIPRIGASITAYGLGVVSQFELMGVPVVNGAEAIARSRDKLRGLQLLACHGIPVPRTVMSREKTDVEEAVRSVGGLPVIVKLTQGTQGIGVMIAHTMAEIASILETMWGLGQEIILQEFIAESKGRDVRVLVIGDRAVAAMRRRARRGEFRSNLHRGGEGEQIELTPAYAQCAVSAARVLGLDVAGIDLLEGESGPQVIEANSSPGFEGIEGATGLDIAGMIVAHAGGLARTPGTTGVRPR